MAIESAKKSGKRNVFRKKFFIYKRKSQSASEFAGGLKGTKILADVNGRKCSDACSLFVGDVCKNNFKRFCYRKTTLAPWRMLGIDKWPNKYKFARAKSLQKFKKENEKEYLFWQFLQYEFSLQWKALKGYANKQGVSIIGDITLKVAYDSADVWLNPKLFKLNADRSLKKVAGVPPDYFSDTGQLWGNPVYNWSVHKKDGYSWWTERIRRSFELYDAVRIDHFRGFDRYYEIDAGERTAINGTWRRGPKYELFQAAENALGKLNIIAEDLGSLDKGVYRLMDETGYPGMKVMEFAFDGNEDNPYLPKNIKENSVCYTGTHDNTTAKAWAKQLPKDRKRYFRSEVGKSFWETDAHALVRSVLESDASLAVVPIQDYMEIGTEGRINVPSTLGGNWTWKLPRQYERFAKHIAAFRAVRV